MSSSAIRAGRAFVEMLVNDESVQASLDGVQQRFRSFAAAVEQSGTGGFSAMNAAAGVSMAATAAAVGVVVTSINALAATVFAIANVFRVSFNYVTTSVTKAAASIGALGLLLKRYLPDSKITGWFNSFLDRNAVATNIGGWARFAGKLTGNSLLFEVGNQIQRAGLGASIVKASRDGGLVAALRQSFGVAAFSAWTSIKDSASIIVTGPLRLIGRLASVPLFPGASAASSRMTALAASSGTAATAIQRTSLAAKSLGATSALITRLSSAMQTLAMRAGLAAAAITGPAILASRKFAATSTEITAKAAETGQSVASLIGEKFGSGSFISAADIEAGSKLSSVMKELRQATADVWAQIGVAALPVLRSMTHNALLVTRAVSLFVSQNRELIGQSITMAGRIAGASAAILGGYKAFGLLATILPMILSPVGLITAGVIALALAFPQLREQAMGVIDYLFGGFSGLGEIVQQTMTGISDAISGGSIATAAKVLWAGLNLAWLQGTESLRSVWRAFTVSVISLAIDMWSGWERISAASANGFRAAWTEAINSVSGVVARIIAYAEGLDVNDVLQTLTEDQDRARKNSVDKNLQQRLDAIEKERQAMQAALGEESENREKIASQALADARAEFAAAREAAAAIRKPVMPEGSKAAAKAAGELTSLTTFSSFALNRQSISGISGLQKATEDVATNTAETVAAIKALQPLAYT